MKTSALLVIVALTSALTAVLFRAYSRSHSRSQSVCQCVSSSSDKTVCSSPDTTAPKSIASYYEKKDVDTEPAVEGFRTAPRYPLDMKRLGISGKAVISYVVMADGCTGEVKVEKATHAAFGEAGVKAVKQWRFEPATKDGKAVNYRMTAPMTFDMTDA